MRRAGFVILLAFLLAPHARLVAADHGETVLLVPDVPADLGGMTFVPWEVVYAHEGSYSTVYYFPSGTAIDALHWLDSGLALLSVSEPQQLGQILVEPEDVVLFDGAGGYSMVFDGSARGVPRGANLDALFRDGGDAGDLVLSFDVPVTLGGQTFKPADLVRFDGMSYGLYALVNPSIPDSTNVIGADRRKNMTLMVFDVPTTLGARTYLPGEVVSWNGVAFAPFHADPAWPPYARINAVSLLPRPGRIPPTLELTNPTPPDGRLRLRATWSSSCSAGAETYAIYEGTIGQWYSHVPIDCFDDGGDLTEDFTPSPGNRYYLVVPLNASDEGSHGVDWLGTELPRGATTCVPSQAISACP